MLDNLNDFIHSNPDARELKRAIAVQMFLKGYKHLEIGESVGVSSGFISKWTGRYKQLGVSGLKLGYSGSVGYLEPEQRQSVLCWLKSKNYWNLGELQGYIEQEYEVVFNSKQSYYTLFEQAGISWKKTQQRNPKKDPKLVKKKQEITAWLEAHRQEIRSKDLVVFFEDECHLLWGDLCGYVWGKTDERISVPVVNKRSKQTYYGAVDIFTQQCLIQTASAGNSEGTIAFLKYLLDQCPNSRIALIWDGALIIAHKRSESIWSPSIKDSTSLNGKLLACAWLPMTPSRTRLKIFGYKPNDSFESITTCVNRLISLSSYLS